MGRQAVAVTPEIAELIKKTNEPNVPAEAMVLVNNQLFIAGPRDVADEKEL